MKLFETSNLIARRFEPADWKDLQEIAVSKENSEFAATDHSWPTDDDGCTKMAEFFSSKEHFVAIELKSNSKVICFISYNGMDDQNVFDIGHVMNLNYLNNGYETEALRVIFDHTFQNLGANGIKAYWALEDKEKIKPLEDLGMKITQTSMHPKFRPEPNGSTGEFEGCCLYISKNEWFSIK